MASPEKVSWTNWLFTPPKSGYKNGSGSAVNKRRGRVHKGDDVTNNEAIIPNGPAGEEIHLEEHQLTNKLESELIEYQYNMGLLVLEKKDWDSRSEELKQQIDEVNTTLKRERAARAIALSDREKNENNLRKALGVEKQCVVELEKALHDIRSKHAEIIFTSESKLAEADALMESLENKSLEVEAKLHDADARLAEVSRKSSEVQIKFQELEARENTLIRERQSFQNERDMNEITLSKQREDVRAWERRLLAAEERLAKGSAMLNQREERVNEHIKILEQKEKDIQEAAKKNEIDSLDLREKLDHLNDRTASLAVKEQEIDTAKRRLEISEKKLLSLEERLNMKEKEEMQKRLEEHNAILDARRREFELELGQKKMRLDEVSKKKLDEVVRMEVEAKHRDEKLSKAELAAERKQEKLKEKEKDLELKAKSLKEREKSVKLEEKRIEHENKQLVKDKEELVSMNAQIQAHCADNEKQLLKINEEKSMLEISEEERSEFTRLQAQLKQEIENCKIQNELIIKESEALKLEKISFERQWEELYEKTSHIDSEMEKLLKEKENLQKLGQLSDEKTENERKSTREYVQRELESLKLDKETFEASMEHEKSVLAQKAKNEKDKLLRDFEHKEKELEEGIRKKREEAEECLHEKERLFEEEKEKKLINISHLKEAAEREMEEAKLEKLKLLKEKGEITEQKKYFEKHQFEMRKDIDQLVALSGKMKVQREQFMEERDRFISYVGKFKNCQNCGELTSDYILSDLRSVSQLTNSEVPPFPKLNSTFLKEKIQNIAVPDIKHDENGSPFTFNSGSPSSTQAVSWLRRCTPKIFKFSPSKQIQLATAGKMAPEQPVIEETARKDLQKLIESEQEPSVEVDAHSLDTRIELENVSSLEMGPSEDLSVHEEDTSSIKKQILEYDRRNFLGGKRDKGVNRMPKFRRTRPVKDVLEHTNTLHETRREHEENEYPNIRKRNHASTSQTALSDDSESRSESASEVERMTRRQRLAHLQLSPGETRYNLRSRPIMDGDSRATRGSSKADKGTKGKDITGGSQKSEIPPIEVVDKQKERSLDLQHNMKDGTTHDDNVLVNDVCSTEVVNRVEQGARNEEDEEEHTESDDSVSDVEDDSDDDSEEDEHPGEASIGKKLWNFLTS